MAVSYQQQKITAIETYNKFKYISPCFIYFNPRRTVSLFIYLLVDQPKDFYVAATPCR